MPRFSLTQLFMGTALIAIGLVFVQAEGCGSRYTMIEGVSFASDDSRLLVTKLTGRDARTPFKFYKADVARTISWLGASAGETRKIVHQDFKPGNCGPAFHLWRIGRTSALCGPSTDLVSRSEFGGGNVTCNVGSEKSKVIPLRHSALNLAFSKSGRFIAASGREGVTVIDTQDNSTAVQFLAGDLAFLDASLMSFTNDDSRIVLAGRSGVCVRDVSAAAAPSTVFGDVELMIHAIAVLADDDVIVCSDNWVRRYDLAGQVVATLADEGGYLCSVSKDGSRLAFRAGDQLTIYDLRSNKILRSSPSRGATALALSSNGDTLAVGDYHGGVSLIDTATGARRWYSVPPGRYRWPWTLPAVFLGVWTVAVWRLSRRRLSLAKQRHGRQL